jgi:hypothetical protein
VRITVQPTTEGLEAFATVVGGACDYWRQRLGQMFMDASVPADVVVVLVTDDDVAAAHDVVSWPGRVA